jgi:streptogramin lyase
MRKWPIQAYRQRTYGIFEDNKQQCKSESKEPTLRIAHLLKLASRNPPTFRRSCGQSRKTRWKEYRVSFEALESRFLPSGGIIEFGGFAPGAYPMGITGGPDGNLWFAEINSIGRLNPSTGAVQDYPLPPGTGPLRITAGPDGNLWFVGEGSLGSINPFTGNIKMYQLTAQNSFLGGSIITGPDGNLWFTEWTGIGRINPNTGVIQDFSTGVNMPDGITLGPDGNLWFTEMSAIGKINPFTGAIQEFPTPPYDFPESNRSNSDPQSGLQGNNFRGGTTADPGSLHQGEIAAGSDSNLWFITARGNHLAGINPNNGTFEELNLPPGVTLEGITAGPDGNLWFTEFATRIGRISPTTGVFQDYNVFLPGTFADEITVGPDGNLWFTHSYYIGEVILDKPLLAAANIGTLNPDVLQNSNGSKGQTFSAISTAVGRLPAVNLQPFPQVGTLPSTLRPLTDQGDGGMGGLIPADGQPNDNLDPMLKTPDSALPAASSNSKNPVDSSQKRESTATFETTPVFEQEINQQEPATLWNLPFGRMFEENPLTPSPGEHAQVEPFTGKSLPPTMEAANANAMLTVLVLGPQLAPRPKKSGLQASLHN